MILKDIKTVIGLDLKLMLKNKAVIIILAIISVLFLLLLKSFSTEINVKSNIPIGIIDEDRTDMSKTFVENCKKQEGIYVYDTTRENLEQKLYKNEITGYFVIKPGFQKNVEKGNVKKLIESYSYKSTSFSAIISDILAGEIIYELCLSNTWNMYANLDAAQSKYNREQFYDYIRKLGEDSQYQYAFDVQFVSDNKGGNGQTAFQYQLIYEQIELGIISMLFCMIAMFLVWSILENPNSQVLRRKSLLFIPTPIFYLGDIVAAGGIMSLYTILGSLFMYLMLHSPNIQKFLYMTFTGIAFSFGIVFVFWCIRKIIKSNTAYQLISFLVIVITGAVSMLSIFSIELEKAAKLIPNYWFIKGITDAIIS